MKPKNLKCIQKKIRSLAVVGIFLIISLGILSIYWVNEENRHPTRSGFEFKGETYETINFGNGKVWLAENLSLDVHESWCYGGDSVNCLKYGRL